MPRWLVLVLTACAAASGCGGGAGSKQNALAGDKTPAAPVLGRPSTSEQAVQELGFPGFATKNTTRIGGADAEVDAAAAALAVYPSVSEDTRPAAVTVVDVDDWRTAISAAQLMSAPLQSPIIYSKGGKLSEATSKALGQLKPTGAAKLGKSQVIRAGDAAGKPAGLQSRDLAGRDYAKLAADIDRLQTAAAGKPSQAVIVAPADRPAFAMPAAAYAAKSGVPVLWAHTDGVPDATIAAIKAHKRPNIYVLGPQSAISEAVLDQLRPLGTVKRVAGQDPVANAVAFARFADGRFGWNVVDPGHGLVFASAERTADAPAAAALSASGTWGPLLLVQDAQALPAALQNYLLDIQPGYDKDPVRGVYNHGWLVGDEDAIAIPVQARIDKLLEIQPVSK
jgi:putative cell wall binding repeat protein